MACRNSGIKVNQQSCHSLLIELGLFKLVDMCKWVSMGDPMAAPIYILPLETSMPWKANAILKPEPKWINDSLENIYNQTYSKPVFYYRNYCKNDIET